MGEEYTYLSNDTVYRYIGGQFHMLYDFGASQGDIWTITADSTNMLCDSLAIMNIDSVYTGTINGFTLKSILASDSIGPNTGMGWHGWNQVI